MVWITKETNAYNSLSQEEMINNATLMWAICSQYMTLNAFAGLMGNVQWESYINPCQWQGSAPVGTMTSGFGLVQWTPASKIFNALGDSVRDGNAQTYAILNLTANDWIATSAYNFSWEVFKSSTESPEYLAVAFCKNYERAGDEHLAERQQYARYWYDYFSGSEPPSPPTPPTPTPVEGKKSKWIFYMKRRL